MPAEYFDKDCNPIPYARWVDLLTNDNEYRQVAENVWYDNDQLRTLSTVWLGLAQGYGPSGPLIFATRVYDQDHDETEYYLHTTEEQALVQHAEILGMHQHLRAETPTSRFFKITKETFDDPID